MKTLIHTLFFFLLITQICFAQWYQQNSGTTNLLLGVSFTDANTGTAVGGSGTILRTTNGGIDWILQTSGTQSNLWGVSFIDANIGTAVGEWGTILRTTNGGATWTSQSSGTTEWLTDVSFTDENNGTAVGYYGTILRTTNGGTDWISQTSGTGDYGFYGVSFTDANTGTAVGIDKDNDLGLIFRTTNGGTTWTSQASNTTRYLTSVFFVDANTGTAVGEHGEILRTTNGGTNWIQQNFPGYYLVTLWGVSFSDASTGTAVGGATLASEGTIIRTTDGGNTWTSQDSGMSNYLYDVSFTDANTGTAVGFDTDSLGIGIGLILHTTNGGVPVELISFTATTNGNEVILSWSTATEINNQLFEVQRSFEGSDFATVGFVNGKGTTTERQDYSYSDEIFTNGKYSYRLKQIDYLGSYEYSDVVEIDFRTFNSYLLEQNYPNPFNPTTTIGFGIQNKSNVKITILNAIGEEVAVLLIEEKEAGFHQVEFDAVALPSGVYFYQLKAGNFISTKKMILLK